MKSNKEPKASDIKDKIVMDNEVIENQTIDNQVPISEEADNIENLSQTADDSILSGLKKEIDSLKEDMFGKKKIIEDLTAERDDLKDKLTRRIADFDNYKKRTDQEKADLIRYGSENLVRNLLPVLDDFERSLKNIDTVQDVNTIKDGIKLISAKFQKLLSEEGLEKIESVNKPFDVNLHDALMQRTAPDKAPQTVLDEFESAYLLKGKVIRHAKVVVSDDNSGSELNISDAKVSEEA